MTGQKQEKEFFQINYLTQIKIANLNGDEGIGGNITTIKKIKGFDNEQYVYISGQALRRYMKDTLHQLGENLTAVNEAGNPKLEGVLKSNKKGKNTEIIKGKHKNLITDVIDLDLFGYMLPKEDGIYGRRWSPVKVSPAVSLLKYNGHKDYLTRKQDTKGKGKSGNIVQVEVDTFNFMNGSILIDTSAIGNLINEYTYEIEKVLDKDKKNSRINKLIEAIKNLNGGAKQARLLNDFSFKFVIVTNQKYGNPFLLNTFTIKINDKGGVNLNLDPIIEAIKEFKYTTNSISVGLRSDIFKNEPIIRKRIKEETDIEVTTINQSLDTLKK
ncbi:type I-B CRISPR-associated protein Cas7/Cst2/DevR [Candidatus Dojkabacteria bacterium]|nr:type I-B CRISPR-associated protein Cas7/Cst2/DevR [Candidatus Dojkabacteria bacterium]